MSRRALTSWLGAAAAFGLATLPAVASGQGPCQPGTLGGGGIEVHDTATGAVTWCSAQAIQDNGDFSSADDPIQANPNSPNANPVNNALSIHSLLTFAGINPADVSFAYIPRSSGAWSTLGNADLEDPSPSFSSGNVPAIRIDDGDETEYMRPLRNPSDDNAVDNIIGTPGQALSLYVHSGPLLTVTISAGDKHPGIGEPVSFAAAVSPATEGLSYSWSFGDGASARSASPSHVYTTTGLYPALVTVKGAGNSGGASQPIEIEVGKARSTPHNRGAGGGSGSRASRNGSSKQAGAGTARAGGHGNSATNSDSKAKADQGSGRDGSAAPSGAAAQAPSGSAADPTASAAPATTTSAKATPAPRERNPTRRPPRAAPAAPATPRVEGRLIAGLVAVAPEQLVSRSSPAAVIQPPAARAPGQTRPLAAVLGGCVIILLLGSGAGKEWVARRRSLTSTSGR